MRFETKIAVVLRADVPIWQRLNMFCPAARVKSLNPHWVSWIPGTATICTQRLNILPPNSR